MPIGRVARGAISADSNDTGSRIIGAAADLAFEG
jgi:hypothetical protein